MPIRAHGLRWSIMFFLLAPITFVMSLDRTAIAVAAPTIQHEYGFSLLEMSVILTSFSYTYALLQVPGGWLAERYGPRRTLFWANALWSALTAATPLGFNLVSFVGLRALLGVGQAADWPSSIVAIRRWFPQRERGKGNSILLGGLYLGPIAAAPITTWVIASFGWRWAFYGFGSLGIVLGIAWWLFFRDHPEEHPNITPEEQAIIGADGEKIGADDPTRRVLALRRGDAVLGDRRAVFLPGDDPEFLHHVAADLPDERPPPVAEGDGDLRLAALGGDVLFGLRHRSIGRRDPAPHRIRLGDARADGDRGLRHQRGGIDACRAHAGRASDDGTALRVAGGGGGDSGVDLALDAGPGTQRHGPGVGLDELLGQCRRRGRADADGGCWCVGPEVGRVQ